MGDKRLKLARGLGEFVPVSISFSDLEKQLEAGDYSYSYEPGDGGMEVKRLEGNMSYEELVVQILCNLEKREKLVFAFQLLRDAGYQIDHGSFAKVIKLSRSQYMRVLSDVRLKASLFAYGYSKSEKGHKEGK